jgi:hypothetical protein
LARRAKGSKPAAAPKKIDWKVVGIVAPIVIAIVGGLWAVYTAYFGPKKETIEATYHVCRIGCKDASWCGNEKENPMLISPADYKSIADWATKECSKYKLENEGSQSGLSCFPIEWATIKCTVER